MVNPLEIMPVLALAVMIVCIPVLADPPQSKPALRRRSVPPRGPTVPRISLKAQYRE